MLVAVGEGGPAANFCVWVQRLGAPTRLVFPPDDSPAALQQVDELRASGMDVCVPSARPDLCLAGARLLHLQARSLLASPHGKLVRAAMDAVRKQKALVSIDLGEAEWIRTRGASRTAYQLATIRPDILFASASAAAELGAPLEGLAAVPVLIFPSQGCMVYGRRIAVPDGKKLDNDALAATFCVAFLEGAAPVEAAGRAILVAATPSPHRGEGRSGGVTANPLPPSGGGSGSDQLSPPTRAWRAGAW
jgi:sugar/nucleoside kinase (ribokinase family)